MSNTNSPTQSSLPPEQNKISMLEVFGLITVIGISLAMRFQHIASVGVSFDESFTMRMIDFPWGEMIERITAETQPPGFYVTLKLWASLFGNTILAGRIFTALWGVGGVICMYFLVKQACQTLQRSATEKRIATQASLLAALMLAVSPLQIFWALQIRMYSMPLTLALLSSLLLLRALDQSSENLTRWCIFTLSATALAYTHYFGMFVLVAQFLVALGVTAKRTTLSWLDRLLPIVGSALCISSMWQWWLPRFLHQRAHVVSNFYLPKLSWSVWGTAFDELWVGHALPLSAVRGLCLTQITVIFVLFVLLGKKRGDVLLALGTVVPLLAACFISVVSQPLITARYLQFSQVFLIPILAVVILRLPGIARTISTLGLVSLTALLGVYQWQDREMMADQPGLQSAVAMFEKVAGQDSLMITSNPMLFCSTVIYSEDPTHIRCFGEPTSYPFYQGTPVMKDAEYIDSEHLDFSHYLNVWTMDAESRSMGSVPLASSWTLMEEHIFKEWYTTIILRRYKRKHQKMRVIQ